MVMEIDLILRSLCIRASHWNIITSEIKYSVLSDNYVIIFMCYVLYLIIRAMKVGNCVFVCMSLLSVYFAVSVSFRYRYLSLCPYFS